MTERVLVCGGRNFADREWAWFVLDSFQLKRGPIEVVIHGAARGADALAADWARINSVPVIACPADWKRYKRAAGPLRNQQMLDEHKPTVVLAFAGGAGTADMVRRAKVAGVPTYKIRS